MIVVDMLGLSHYHINFRNGLPVYIKTCIDFDQDCTESQMEKPASGRKRQHCPSSITQDHSEQEPVS